ncbi:MAG: inositol monophosphatase [Verrucomicrobiota bacterium]
MPQGSEIDRRITVGLDLMRSQILPFHNSFGAVESEWKSDASRVTETDRIISDSIMSGIAREFSEDDCCSEELDLDSPKPLVSRFCWILDPVDGTNNFAIGMPNCAISLALLENGMPVYGWVYDFAGRQLIHGGAGRGIFVGDQQVERRVADLGEQTPIGIQFPLSKGILEKLLSVLNRERVRSLGSSTMEGVYVALGHLKGAVDFKVKVWDIAAFVAFFREFDVPYRFLRDPAFPLQLFDLKARSTPFVAGSNDFCEEIEALLSSSENSSLQE